MFAKISAAFALLPAAASARAEHKFQVGAYGSSNILQERNGVCCLTFKQQRIAVAYIGVADEQGIGMRFSKICQRGQGSAVCPVCR